MSPCLSWNPIREHERLTPCDLEGELREAGIELVIPVSVSRVDILIEHEAEEFLPGN